MLKVSNLNIHFGDEHVIKNVSFDLQPNQILGIVGESGSGKSVSTLSILGLLGAKAKVEGSILFQDRELTKSSEQQFQQIRGNDISMIFQEPMSSLNPSMRCGKQVEEVLIRHKQLSKAEVKQEVLSLFEKVKLPRPEAIFKSYPHQISGGQKQRVMIAMAIACKPKILIADEPTTALDVTVQKEILKLLKSLQQETEMSIIFISHDLALVSELADRVAVMYQGEIVEQDDVVNIFKNARHQYTKALLASKPSTRHRLKALPTVKDYMQEVPNAAIETSEERKKRHELIYSRPPLLEVRNVKKTFISNAGWFEKTEKVNAVDDVSFKIYEGETLGLVGESGCGKSTLGNAILRLDDPTEGEILYQGKSITRLKGEALRHLRKDIQLIFQDPFSSLNPRLSVGKTIMEPMKVHGLYGNAASRREKTIQILKRVGLSEEHFDRYPHEFSGGQRQRIGIARTIAVEPKLIICDESVSALDISVQAQVLNLLNELKSDFGFTYIFISHDLAVVKYMADQLLVMHQGKIVERGEADAVYAHPEKAYTKQLIEAIPKGL
ncbi:ABC transporter ATP-binding protein [Psychroflexus sp. YR1-1]|uniref:ABC transporter ATP-binding protein n=1 Tax=Psychroflexus aurantiacus TaxID=2709310 RepID=A0A6B3R5Q5_9FLAO|nr:ABC transporter ATP-binding protein [Psychroflexus aurantiacus]NEV94447.1 ABC transporter ATP-binding protein [Psychroflexus aurantiacus]